MTKSAKWLRGWISRGGPFQTKNLGRTFSDGRIDAFLFLPACVLLAEFCRFYLHLLNLSQTCPAVYIGLTWTYAVGSCENLA